VAHLFASNAISDYARACDVRGYLGKIGIQNGWALVLGDMPVETTAWVNEPGSVLILKLLFIEPDADIPNLLRHAQDADFRTPVEVADFEILGGCIVIFDASLGGLEKTEERIVLNTPPGRYQISTAVLHPDPKTSVVVHKLFRIGNARANIERSRT
jgi:hypothetical protein